MTYPDPYDPLEGLDATDEERRAYLRVLDEMDAEAAGLPYEPEPEPDPYGPWDDFHAATAQMDQAHQLDTQRLAEDVADQIPDRRPPSAEVKLQRALDRIASGTYTPPAQFRGDRDAHGQFAPGACGDTDQGYCTSRYHDPGCSAAIAQAAATGDAAAAEAWAATLRNRPPDPGALGYSAELAGDPLGGLDTWSDLLAPRSADPATVHARMLAVLDGEQAAEPGYAALPEQMPPVGDLRSALGL